MKKTILVLAGAACFALLPACALGQQDSKAPADGAKATTTQDDKPSNVDQNYGPDSRGKSRKRKQMKESKKKAPAKEPAENEKIFDEMLRSAQTSGAL